MRITKIEFENLNSLKGKWAIDLDHEAFKRNHNQFVICGETGAGKTTILDAITLALYGKTARLDRISETNNEIMTRCTNYCMASVTYECRNGKYISRFSQGKKPRSGKLDKVDFSISTSDGEIIFECHKQQDFQKKTAEIIQLDYEQFCRSILLAQGEFNLFLEGDGNDTDNERKRAEILAKINGTEKYKEVGKRVCEKSKEKKEKYDLLKSGIEEIKTLSQDEIDSITIEKKSITEKLQKFDLEIEQINEILNWHKQINELQEDVNKSKENRKRFEEQKKIFEEELKTLGRAKKAKNCESEYISFETSQKRCLENKKNLSSAELKLTTISEDLKVLEKELVEANEKYSSEFSKTSENELLWKTVRNLDSQIKPFEENYIDSRNRKNECEKKLENSRNEIEIIETKTKNLNTRISDLQKDLESTKKNKELPQQIGYLKEKYNSLRDYEIKIDEENKNIATFSIQLKNLVSQKSVKEVAIENLKSKLKEVFSLEYLSIAKVLRSQLSKNVECPVCGSKEHPFCSDGFSNENIELDSKTVELSQDISSMQKNIENLTTEINLLSEKISKINSSIENSKKNIDEEQLEKDASVSQINKTLVEWEISITNEHCVSEIESVINKLDSLYKKYEADEKLLDNCKIELSTLQTKFESINLKDIEHQYSAEKMHFEEIEKKVNDLKKERIKIFGDKSVDKEEMSFKKNIETLFKNFDILKNKKNEITKLFISADENMKNLKTVLENENKELERIEKSFNDALNKNEFKTIEEFKQCRLSDEEITTLETQKENLAEMDVQTKTALDGNEKKLEECQKKNLSEKTTEDIIDEKNTVMRQKDLSTNRLAEINLLIENDKKNKELFQSKMDELKKAEEESLVWDEMKNFVGKNDGSDLEVFVQSMALKNLLAKANKYIHDITGKYSLVQKENMVDFLIHDDNYPSSKDDRPISNLSGGEKFIVSLSLALGIAELASRNVQVNSLFLDEGFGTLSGTPLIESINALKALEVKGKTLGIITHVSEVIKEFDLQIKAEKRGGVSVLKGEGVSSL